MNRRDIELLITARETTGRPFRAVASNIDQLNRKIGEQVQQAERGEISLRDLRQTQEELAQAGRDLSSLQGMIDGWRRLEQQNTKNTTAFDAAQQELVQLIAEMGAADRATAAQERRLASVEKRIRSTGAAVEATTADMVRQREALQAAGIDVDRLNAAQTRLVNSARATGQGLTAVGGAIANYGDNIRRVRAEEEQLAAQNTFNQKVAQAAQLRDAARFVDLYAQAINTVKVADNQLAALTGFRAVGQMAAEASRDISQFVTSGQTVAVSTNSIAAGLRAIIEPGREALNTLSGIEAQIEQAGAAATAEKGTIAGYSAAINDLNEAAAALVRSGSLIDSFQRQADVTQRARDQFQAAQADVQRLGRAMQAADQPTEELARDLRQAEQTLQSTGRQLTAEETKLGELSRALRQAGIDTNDLTGAQERLTNAARQSGDALEQANTRLGRGGRKTNGLFGLNPYELQNLGFQLNDIFVSLASGQRPLTVFVQQGAQIAQIIPGLISGLAKLALRFFPLIAIVTAVGGALFAAYKQFQRVQAFTNALATIGGNYDPTQLANIQRDLEGLGVKAEDAKNAMLSLAREGFSTAEIDRYTEAAARSARVTGVDLTRATELLVGVRRGGIEAVENLAQQTGLLTESDLEHIDTLFELGRAEDARNYAMEIVQRRQQALAEATESGWTRAVRNLTQAYRDFVNWSYTNLTSFFNWISQKVSQATNTLLGLLDRVGLGNPLRRAGNAISGFFGSVFAPTADLFRRGGPPPRVQGVTGQQIRDREFARQLDEEIDATRTLTSQERLRRAEVDARRRAQAAGVSAALQDRAVTQAIAAEQRKINQEQERANRRAGAAGRRAEAAQRRAQRESEAAQRRVDQVQAELTRSLRQLDSATGRGSSATLEERLRVVDNRYESIFETLQRMRTLGITTAADGTSLDEIERQVNASKERLQNEERIKFYEDQVDLLTRQRADEIENITDAQERGAKTVTEAYQAAGEVNARISPQIVQAAQNALQIARSIAGTNPSPEMVSMIARLERIISGEGTTPIVNRVGLDALETQEQRLNTILRERQDLVEQTGNLVERQTISEAEGRQRIADAYAATGTAIRPMLAQLRETIELLHQQNDALTGLPLLSDTAYAAWQARLQAIEADLTNVDARMTQIQQAARQGIQTGVTNAFQTVADTLVGLVAGTESWGDALNNVLRAGLSLVGEFLKAIADVLVQMVALRIAKSLIGGGFGGFFFHGGGVVGVGGSRRKRSAGSGSWFGAPRFHDGLRPGEYKAVLERGEEVLTEDNPRHISNFSARGDPMSAPSIKQVLLLDPSEVASAMQGRAGQRTFMTFIRANKETIKQVLG